MSTKTFAALHRSADPLVLFNIWDAGSARAVAAAGAKAIATGSLSVAGAQGYEDGEALPFDALLRTVRQIRAVTEVPLSVDIETGYSSDLANLAANAKALLAAGAVGCNLEDRLLGSDRLRDAAEQADRIFAVAETGLFLFVHRGLDLLDAILVGDLQDFRAFPRRQRLQPLPIAKQDLL